MSDQQTKGKARAYAAAVDELLRREFPDTYPQACLIAGGHGWVVKTIEAHAETEVDGFTLPLKTTKVAEWSLVAHPDRPGTFAVQCTMHPLPRVTREWAARTDAARAKALRINLELGRAADDIFGQAESAGLPDPPPLTVADMGAELRAVLSLARTTVGGGPAQQRLGLEAVVDRLERLVARCDGGCR